MQIIVIFCFVGEIYDPGFSIHPNSPVHALINCKRGEKQITNIQLFVVYETVSTDCTPPQYLQPASLA